MRVRLETILSSRDQSVAAATVAAGACGALASAPLPPALRVLPLLVFMLTGVGCAVMCWIDMPTAPTVAAVVGISLAAMMAVAVTMAWMQFWHPVPSCLILASLTTASGLIRLRTLHFSRRAV